MKTWIWNGDNGDGTYTNPILYTDYSDPDVIRVGEDYYMAASSFCNTPSRNSTLASSSLNTKCR